MKRDEILETAKELVNGPRAKSYGEAYKNHERIALMWSVLLEKRHHRFAGIPVHGCCKTCSPDCHARTRG